MFRRDSVNYVALSIGLDVLAVMLALVVAQELRTMLPMILTPYEFAEVPAALFVIAPLLWLVAAFTLAVYNPRRSYRILDELQTVVVAVLATLLLLAGALYFSFRDVSRMMIVYYCLTHLLLVVGWRVGMRTYVRLSGRQATYRQRPTVIIGTGELAEQVTRMIAAHAWTGLDLRGFITDEARDTVAGYPVLGGLEEAVEVIQREGIEEVVVTLPYREYEQFNRIVAGLQDLPVQVRVVPNYLNLALYRATVESFSGLPLINLRDPALTASQRLIKRLFDIVAVSCLIMLSAPVMAAVALAVRLESEGPIIFKQRRVGENGKLFTMYKFRSMYVDAEQRQIEAFKDRDLGEIQHKQKDDPRVTRVGRFIRRTSLDELPQFFNVLEGSMSLVGPRPEMPWLVEKYEPWQRKRFAVMPGITGWWQVNGRGDRPMHLNTEDDLYYIQNYSLMLDLNIIWKTFAVVARGRGAY